MSSQKVNLHFFEEEMKEIEKPKTFKDFLTFLEKNFKKRKSMNFKYKDEENEMISFDSEEEFRNMIEYTKPLPVLQIFVSSKKFEKVNQKRCPFERILKKKIQGKNKCPCCKDKEFCECNKYGMFCNEINKMRKGSNTFVELSDKYKNCSKSGLGDFLHKMLPFLHPEKKDKEEMKMRQLIKKLVEMGHGNVCLNKVLLSYFDGDIEKSIQGLEYLYQLKIVKKCVIGK